MSEANEGEHTSLMRDNEKKKAGADEVTTVSYRSTDGAAVMEDNSPNSHSVVNMSNTVTPTHISPVRQGSLIENVTDRVTLSWKETSAVAPLGGGSCFSKKKEGSSKRILKELHGIINPGTLIAVMGASGAGKTTFMNVLTCRNLGGLQIGGQVLVNGEPLGSGITRVSAYVQQDDIFIGCMTVREQLWFTAMLRMDDNITKETRELRIEEVLAELGLKKCENTYIGIAGTKKSISGGERKRLAFASEILTNPALMFCDEPTSGLDSFMAQSVVQTLSDMASKGKTILCTIHQPSSEVFALFDSLLLLGEGNIVYHGSTLDALDFFEGVGYPCPKNFNPADHYIRTLAIAPGNEEACRERVQLIATKFAETDTYKEMRRELDKPKAMLSPELQKEIDDLKYGTPYKQSAWRQFYTVLWRCWITQARDPLVFRSRLGQVVVGGLFLGLIYLQQDIDTEGVMNINGALFMLQITASLGNMFAVINTFPLEYPVFVRENGNGMYRVSVYYLAKIIAEVPTFILMPVILVTITYWMIGLYETLEAYLIATAALVIVSNVALSFGYLMSTMSSNVSMILAVAPVVMTPLMMFGGFFLNSDSVPVYFIWLQYLSWFNYCNEILVVNQWKDITHIDCSIDEDDVVTANPDSTAIPSTTPTFCYPDGQAVIDSLGYDEDNLGMDFGIMLALAIGFRLVSFIILLVRTRRKAG